MDERIGCGLYQSFGNRGSVGRVSVFRLCMRRVGRGLGTGPERVRWCYVCMSCLDFLCRWQAQVSVYCARRINAHLRCT